MSRLSAQLRRIAQVNLDIEGIEPGTMFRNRQELSDAGVHLPTIHGIHSVGEDNVYSVVLHGGYEDNVDDGEEIIYTGQGKGAEKGQAVRGQRQAGGQNWKKGPNAALKNAIATRLPIRVIRGDKSNSDYAPRPGGTYKYRYDGLYTVDECWEAPGKAGYMMCMFKLKRYNDGKVTYAIPKRTDPA
ncbi:hypothetical protein PTI98_006649 [Pleurotus ostreatus]|nr:hypothetical protein PTI98_006649 [Pleurotus ostreatus]